MDLKKDIQIRIYPFMAFSKNLIEGFYIIGYNEKVLEELSPNFSEKKLELSLISSIIADSSFNIDIRDIIDKVYPDRPDINIIANNSKIKPETTNIVFTTCLKTNTNEDEPERKFYSCFAFRFHELFIDQKGNQYDVPKAFLIISQYPYFTQYYNLCSYLYENIIEKKKLKENIELLVNIDKKSSIIDDIPIEILIYCLLNYVPSPFYRDLEIKLLDMKKEMSFPALSGYPHIDFDLFKIIKEMRDVSMLGKKTFSTFLKIYILIFLEVNLIIFSENIEKLNLFLYVLFILNYPLQDSLYLANIYSISKKK